VRFVIFPESHIPKEEEKMKTYEKPEMEVIELENDAILTSGDEKVDGTMNATAADGNMTSIDLLC